MTYYGGNYGPYGWGRKSSDLYDEDAEYKKYADYYEEYFNTVNENTVKPLKETLVAPIKEDLERKKRLDDQVRKMMLQEYAIVKDVKEAEEEFNKTSKSSYFLGKDGWMLYQPMMVNGNKIITVTKVDTCPLMEEPSTNTISSFEIKNKIPGSLFKDILASFYLVCKQSDEEAAAQIYKNRKTGDYFIYYPQQIITRGSVTYNKDPNIQTLRVDNELICELHSHNTMGAFWSSTDNTNEKEIGFYVVIGGMGKQKLEYRARVKYCDSFCDLKLSDLFDFGNEPEDIVLEAVHIPSLDPNTAEIMKVISRPIYKVYSNYTYTNSSNSPISNKFTNPYISKQHTPDSKACEVQGTLFPEMSGEVDDSISMMTQSFITKLSFRFCSKNVSKSADYQYLYCVSNNSVKALSNIDKMENRSVYDTLIDGYCLPEYNNDIYSQYSKEIYIRVSARIAEFASLTHCATIPADDKAFVVYVHNIDNTDAVDANYNLQEFWESLSRTEKYILADFFGLSIYDLGESMYKNEVATYMSIRFLYTIIMSGKDGRNAYLGFLSMLETSFADAMDSLTGTVIDTTYMEDDDLSKLLLYLDAAQDKMSFKELFDNSSEGSVEVDTDYSYEMNKDIPPENIAL